MQLVTTRNQCEDGLLISWHAPVLLCHLIPMLNWRRPAALAASASAAWIITTESLTDLDKKSLLRYIELKAFRLSSAHHHHHHSCITAVSPPAAAALIGFTQCLQALCTWSRAWSDSKEQESRHTWTDNVCITTTLGQYYRRADSVQFNIHLYSASTNVSNALQ